MKKEACVWPLKDPNHKGSVVYLLLKAYAVNGTLHGLNTLDQKPQYQKIKATDILDWVVIYDAKVLQKGFSSHVSLHQLERQRHNIVMGPKHSERTTHTPNPGPMPTRYHR